MPKIINITFQLVINGWDIEIVDNEKVIGDKVINFSAEELRNQEPNYVALTDILSDMSYKDNKAFFDEVDDNQEGGYTDSDFFEEVEYDKGIVEDIVKKFFDDDTLLINIKSSTSDT